ncbi:MAG: hypothetical protein WC197_00605 [Candidatus Gastranaerophilaceae bacterium]|jgi:hypothetical protein
MPHKLENQSTALKITENKIAMLDKLNQQHLIDKISYLKQKADLILQKFELEKTKINNEATAYKLKILAESEKETLPQNNSKKKTTKPKIKNTKNKTKITT